MSKPPSNTNAGSSDLRSQGLIKSPCVRNCCLDHKDICLGCFRHISEITGWGTATDERKKQLLELAQERKKNYKLVMPFESSTRVK